jgi:hypothetical protein
LLARSPRVAFLGQRWPIAALILLSLASAITLARYRENLADHGLPAEAAARALRERHVVHSRIALTGSLLVSGTQYAFYDKRLTNFVQFIGEDAAHHEVRQFSDCQRFMRSIAAGRYDFVVAEATAGAQGPIQWLRSDPSARQIFRDERGRVSAFEIVRAPSPLECP